MPNLCWRDKFWRFVWYIYSYKAIKNNCARMGVVIFNFMENKCWWNTLGMYSKILYTLCIFYTLQFFWNLFWQCILHIKYCIKRWCHNWRSNLFFIVFIVLQKMNLLICPSNTVKFSSNFQVGIIFFKFVFLEYMILHYNILNSILILTRIS